ncbi:hypothetical protein K469DRAFT_308668 [Zopfia rhizophila CBS 207.26]|uniref:Uncharacterized protein n=1 Tax=Zopfia rhizophila CBS 207.26 TaxID=1314779 RepID=A0A6A6EMK3_9PEZI|nr:hypothetical protein K469DRAFT_308668 [Zopfia rhizophila CBS 207.26]
MCLLLGNRLLNTRLSYSRAARPPAASVILIMSMGLGLPCDVCGRDATHPGFGVVIMVCETSTREHGVQLCCFDSRWECDEYLFEIPPVCSQQPSISPHSEIHILQIMER